MTGKAGTGEYKQKLFVCRLPTADLSVESELLRAVLVYLPVTQVSVVSIIVSVLLLLSHYE